MNSNLRTVFAGTAPAAKVLAAFDMFFHVQSSEGFRLQIRTFRSHFLSIKLLRTDVCHLLEILKFFCLWMFLQRIRGFHKLGIPKRVGL